MIISFPKKKEKKKIVSYDMPKRLKYHGNKEIPRLGFINCWWKGLNEKWNEMRVDVRLTP